MRRVLFIAAGVAVVAALATATCSKERIATQSKSVLRTADSGIRRVAPRRRRNESAPAVADATDAAPATSKFFTEYEPPATPEHVVRGRVVDSRGAPVVGAEALLVSSWLPEELLADRLEILPGQCRLDVEYPHMESAATTGADGAFAVAYREGGGRRLYVRRGDWVDAVVDDVTDERELVVVSADRAPALVVRVVDADGEKPVVGATVSVRQFSLGRFWPDSWVVAPRPGSAESTSDVNGRARFEKRAAGPIEIDVTAAGFAPSLGDRAVIPADGDASVEVRLTPGVTIVGRVVDAATGAPVAGAEIRVDPRRVRDDTVAKCDADGRFRCEHVPAGFPPEISVEARATGFAVTSAAARGTGDTDGAWLVDVALPRPCWLRARCVDARGAPIPNAIVSAKTSYDIEPRMAGALSRLWLVTDEASADADADGRATIEGLHPGDAGLEPSVAFRVRGVVVLERSIPALRAGETRDLGNVVLSPPASDPRRR